MVTPTIGNDCFTGIASTSSNTVTSTDGTCDDLYYGVSAYCSTVTFNLEAESEEIKERDIYGLIPHKKVMLCRNYKSVIKQNNIKVNNLKSLPFNKIIHTRRKKNRYRKTNDTNTTKKRN